MTFIIAQSRSFVNQIIGGAAGMLVLTISSPAAICQRMQGRRKAFSAGTGGNAVESNY
jgi:hypothetical protein